MALRKQKSLGKGSSNGMAPSDSPNKTLGNINPLEQKMIPSSQVGTDVDIDLREVYFLIMHFLSAGPCKRTCGQFWNELLEHQLLPRRYHAWYSRSGTSTGDEDDDGMSLPLSYIKLEERYPHIDKDHLVKILKQLIAFSSSQPPGILGGGSPNAADVPTLLGSGSFSLLESDKNKEVKGSNKLPAYLRWPHMQADQVRGLSLREIGGGFTKHHRAPSIRAACYAIAKPSTLVQKMETIKRLRGHQNAVYCATFDRLGQYVITGSDDRLVKIWSMETAFCLASCRGHEGDITDLAVNTNNTMVASSANDFVIRVWRLPDGFPISVLRGHTGAVTAIAFSPRLGAVYQLLSSSDDGSCRIWDARTSSHKPKIYIPKPPEVAGKGNDPSPSAGQQSHQILCCAFNSSGTVFVTGSSDTYARVWNACKINTDDSEHYHEMDLLAGHENDVNYVQFSGCAVASRSSIADAFKEDNLPKFKNSWFTYDNIVTCSRDGSAIIWVPRSRRSHGKVGRWTRAYHLKVPPPPMPPQPPRGGPRQRYQQTPRGVNMIVWSLDNRFVLAAIMDCRICVWNASDGSLVHSLTGHKESTFVLDVHPFNPRIAMSAGYDGKTIIWDIWEGKPVRIFEIGHFKLVDGKFSPDGTSIVLSDDVGQIYFVATGEGESQKDAKYDQFFLGDYRPLMQDTHGNALDQETQLSPYRRNIQDLLCDSSMIPYPEPYQSMYQRCRLGILGIEWRPTSLNLAVGPTYNVNTGDFQALPIVDLDQWIEPLPEVADAIEWEPENEMQSDDSDSEFNVADECSSGGEQESLSKSSSSDTEVSGPSASGDHDNNGLRRSKRKKRKSKAELITSSGRRVKRRNLDERDGIAITRDHKSKKLRNGCSIKRNKSSKSKSIRRHNRSARNVRTFGSKISGASTDGEYEDELWESESESESASENFCSDSDGSVESNHDKHSRKKEGSREECEDVKQPRAIDNQINSGNRKRLVLKLPIRHSVVPVGSSKSTCLDGQNNVDEMNSSSFGNRESAELYHNDKLEQFSKDTTDENMEVGTEEHYQPYLSAGCQANSIKWGEVKVRSSKRVKYSTDAWSAPKLPDVVTCNVESSNNEHIKFDECAASYSSRIQDVQNSNDAFVQDNTGNYMPSPERHTGSLRNQKFPCVEQNVANHGDKNGALVLADEKHCHNFGTESRNTGISVVEPSWGTKNTDKDLGTSKIGILKLQIKSKVSSNETNSALAKAKSVAVEGLARSECEVMPNFPVATSDNLVSVVHGGDEGSSYENKGNCDVDHASSIEAWNAATKKTNLDSNGKMYTAVYKRSKSSRGRKSSVAEADVKEESTSNSNDNFDDASISRCRTRFMGMSSATDGSTPSDHVHGSRKSNVSLGTSPSRGKLKVDANDQFLGENWNRASKGKVGLRSARNRRENYNSNSVVLNKRKHPQRLKKISWLMLSEHEEGYRYIPQKGDKVAYLRQGHEEFIDSSRLHDMGPWKSLKGNIRAVETCTVREIEYSTVAGSGESCCKLLLEFVDPSSDVFGKTFKITLPDLVSFPDFLVEKTRYDFSIERNWALRDKCQIWWKNANGDGGSWWEGRIMIVKSKSPDFPDSPWNKYEIYYRVDPPEKHWHSPWELYDTNIKWEHPHIDESKRDVLLESILKLEDKSLRNQDRYGIQRLSQAAEKSDFLNRFPVPLSLDVIKLRLENNYYRTTEAVTHDASVMLSNAEAYFSKSTEIALKMRRLSDWFAKLFSSL